MKKLFIKLFTMFLLQVVLLSWVNTGALTLAQENSVTVKVKYSPFAILNRDAHLFQSNNSTSKRLDTYAKGTFLICNIAQISSDSSEYIEVYRPSVDDNAVNEVGYIATNYLTLISLNDGNSIINDEKTIAEVLSNPGEISDEIVSDIFISQGRAITIAEKTNVNNQITGIPTVIEVLPYGSKVYCIANVSKGDEGSYVYVLTQHGTYGYIQEINLQR